MPWFPDFVNAAELARRQTRAAGQADPVGPYFTALTEGDSHELETVWPGEVVVYDPRAGEIRGHRELRRFVRLNRSWPAQRRARIETVASTCAGGRAVVELLAHLAGEGPEVAWPVAAAELRSFFTQRFDGGGGIGLQHCAVTGDGARCALEYNCVRWGRHDLTPQAGIGVYERGADGLPAAARIYDDVEAPAGRA